MSLQPGEEFRIVATPSQELLRKLTYLAAVGSESVLTVAGLGGNDAASDRKAAKADGVADIAQLIDQQRARQRQIEQINETIDRMDEASVTALQEIEEELLAIRRDLDRMREEAYHDEQGNMILVNEAGTAAFYEDGTQLPDEEFEAIKELLRGRPTSDTYDASIEARDALLAERDLIHEHDALREQVREELSNGVITPEEAEERLADLTAAAPDRMKRILDGGAADRDAAIDTTFSADEFAAATIRSSPQI